MPAPKKKYFDPTKSPAPRLAGEHLVVPFPALQGLIRALLSEWNCDDAEKRRLENQLIVQACWLGDPKCLKICEEDKNDVQQHATQQVADHMTKILKEIGRPCPTWLLQMQAQALDQLLKESVYPKLKKVRNPASVVRLLRDYLPPIQKRVFFSVALNCRDENLHPRSLPPDEILSKWGRISQPSRLRNTIIAYYHGKATDYTKQVLAKRHN